MRTINTFLFILFIIAFGNLSSRAQSVHQTDGSYRMKIPQVTAMAGSPAHLYITSKKDGLIVFRVLKDSLQWLYTTSKIPQTVNSIRADGRFAYLFGDSLNLTIVDPTTLDKNIPSATLPSFSHGAVRWQGYIYIALGTGGLGKLNLNAAHSKSSIITRVKPSLFNGQSIIDIEASSRRMFILSNNQKLFIFDKTDNGIHFKKKIHLPHRINRIFKFDDTLIGSNNSGVISRIYSKKGHFQRIGRIGEPVQKIDRWKKRLIIKGKSHRLWVTDKKGTLHLWKRDSNAGNYFAVTRGQLWLCQYNRVKKVKPQELLHYAQTKPPKIAMMGFGKILKIQSIKNQTVPYPHNLLVPIKLQTSLPVKDIQLHLKTSAAGAKIRGQSLYWKPDYDNVGKQYSFKIIAATDKGKTSSTRFKVSVESYNSPPNFIPVRPVAIPSGHWYHLKIKARDPDGSNTHLVRYLGVNLPKGASVDSQTGLFQWKPTNQQVGKHKFRIIATDQYGAAAYENVTIQVLGSNNK